MYAGTETRRARAAFFNRTRKERRPRPSSSRDASGRTPFPSALTVTERHAAELHVVVGERDRRAAVAERDQRIRGRRPDRRPERGAGRRAAGERAGRAEAATGLAQRDAHQRPAPSRTVVATTAAPFGCDATSVHEYDSPSRTVSVAVSPAESRA